jgi:hypothetical protein
MLFLLFFRRNVGELEGVSIDYRLLVVINTLLLATPSHYYTPVNGILERYQNHKRYHRI